MAIMKEKLKIIWQLFATFFKIGLFTFGGGYAMISIIEMETVDKHHWCTSEDIMDMIVIAESTPGIVAINSATFIGFKMAGIVGGILATLGVVLPSFIIISALYFALDAFLANIFVAAAFRAVRACVVVLIAKAVMTLFKQMQKNLFAYIVCVLSYVIATFTNFDVIWLILIGAVIGLIFTLITNKKRVLQTVQPLNVEDVDNTIEQSSIFEDANKTAQYSNTDENENKTVKDKTNTTTVEKPLEQSNSSEKKTTYHSNTQNKRAENFSNYENESKAVKDVTNTLNDKTPLGQLDSCENKTSNQLNNAEKTVEHIKNTEKENNSKENKNV